jgi:hypothetical protein
MAHYFMKLNLHHYMDVTLFKQRFIKKFSDNQRSKLQIPSDCGTIGVNDKVFLMSEDEYKVKPI